MPYLHFDVSSRFSAAEIREHNVLERLLYSPAQSPAYFYLPKHEEPVRGVRERVSRLIWPHHEADFLIAADYLVRDSIAAVLRTAFNHVGLPAVVQRGRCVFEAEQRGDDSYLDSALRSISPFKATGTTVFEERSRKAMGSTIVYRAEGSIEGPLPQTIEAGIEALKTAGGKVDIRYAWSFT